MNKNQIRIFQDTMANFPPRCVFSKSAVVDMFGLLTQTEDPTFDITSLRKNCNVDTNTPVPSLTSDNNANPKPKPQTPPQT